VLLQATCVSLPRILALQGGSVEANSLFEYLVGQFHDAACEIGEPGLVASLRENVSSASGVPDLWNWLRASPLAHAFDLRISGANVLDGFFAGLNLNRSRGLLKSVTEAPLYALGPGFLSDSLFSALQDPTDGADLRRALDVAARSPAPLLLYHRLFHLILSREHFYKVREIESLSVSSASPYLGTAFLAGATLESLLKGIDAELRGVDARQLEERRRSWQAKKEAVRPLLWEGSQRWLPPLLALSPTTERAKKLAREIADGAKEVRFLGEDELLEQLRARPGRAAGAMPLVRIEAMHLTPEENNGRGAILLLDPRQTQPNRPGADPFLDAAANAVHEDLHLEQPMREFESIEPTRDFAVAEEEAHAAEARFRLANGEDYFIRLASALSPSGYAMGLRNWIEQVYLRQLPVPKFDEGD